MEKRIINFDTEMVGSGGEIVLPDLPQEQKDKLVAQAIETASYVLLFTMKCVKVENFITGTIDNKGITYELSFKKSQPSEQKPSEGAEGFLRKAAAGYEPFTPFGLNKLPYVLYDAVSKVMQEYAQQSMKQERDRAIQECVDVLNTHHNELPLAKSDSDNGYSVAFANAVNILEKLKK